MTGRPTCGCWIYCGASPTGSTRPPAAGPRPSRTGWRPSGAGRGPPNRRILYNRASADPEGKPWSERKAYVWWDADEREWAGHDVPDFHAGQAPRTSNRRPGATGPDALSGRDPFIMQADGKAWLFAPAGVSDGPLPTHYEPQESPVANPLYGQHAQPRP